MGLNEKQIESCETNRRDFSDLRAVFLSCTLKKSPEVSHTEALMAVNKQSWSETASYRNTQTSGLPYCQRRLS